MTSNAGPFPIEQILALVLESFKSKDHGAYEQLVNDVVALARSKGIYTRDLNHNDRFNVGEEVRQILWQLLVQNIVVFGTNASNPEWPWYRLTRYGRKVVDGQGPQPHDPEGFLAEFQRLNPSADPVIVDYLGEAVRSFNHGCQKAAIVMLGCASEKAILVLLEAFESSISDPAQKQKFEKSCGWTISSRFGALRDRLLFMMDQKRIPKDLHEKVRNDLIGCFELLRRQRNAAGHPELITSVNPDGVFLSLRIFPEYVRSVYELVSYFSSNPADPY